MKRKRMSRRSSRRSFRRNAVPHKKNNTPIMRGGFRL